jgi:predicted phosphoribosyltransferase
MEEWQMQPVFKDRLEAGYSLGPMLQHLAGNKIFIIAISQGGISVAAPVARQLKSPLDLVISLKIPIPARPQASLGAVTSDGTLILNEQLITGLDLTPNELESIIQDVKSELSHLEELYRKKRPYPDIAGRIVVMVDDGLASSCMITAAVQSLLRYQPVQIIMASPVMARRTQAQICSHFNEVITLVSFGLPVFAALFYEYFPNLTDQQVIALLNQYRPEFAVIG